MDYVSAVPTPRSEAGPDAASTGGRRSLATALVLGAIGAAVVLLSSGQTWAEGRAAIGAGGSLPLSADGGDVTGVPTALAIVGLAALVAVFAVRSAGRLLVSAILALCGAGAAASAFIGAGDSSALDEKAARVAGNTAATIDSLSHTAWPYVTAVGSLLILMAGLLALRYGKQWPAMSGRYERDGTPRPRRAPRRAPDPERPEEIWKALDRGEDPTREA
ncbi:TIGR02234 family membrane protein [Streptomyces sp. NPDC051320]|uniref:TIGR02234 family membrane protein n=1 Tax=Streptomyces sp. NPDC051320 TaxID=3154644 RepID=UPI00342F0118